MLEVVYYSLFLIVQLAIAQLWYLEFVQLAIAQIH